MNHNHYLEQLSGDYHNSLEALGLALKLEGVKVEYLTILQKLDRLNPIVKIELVLFLSK